MSEVTNNPTHNRLLAKLRAMGPYLRDPQSKEGLYYFDCLSVCIDDRKSPELREFWGWWMELEATEGGFTANYHIGKYDVEGNWLDLAIPKNTLEEVNKTQNCFHLKLVKTLEEHFQLSVAYHEQSVEFV
ncbi:XRE family transcriptional regulator [Vibrio vulnificus]|uniref:sigma factor-binding protein Crl n=1 Tax=Vibrio vulnificus TaxID=672 RepID=UPI0006AD349E|nr:sigma factor-binding protein Crl [Vibrio vulnificus]KOR98713.1 XRE family transcriptional regulator [Vibrio vulnificus]HDY8065057.1 sigma factor-binding protein Crl [Vibrio vulnificus]HDY8067783.1 sigma factor-binding protein Crl [Vibrio vulnificus]